MLVAASWIELHNAGRVSDRFNPRSGENYSYEVIPILPEPSLERLKVVQCFPDMLNGEKPKNTDNDYGRDRDGNSQFACVLWPEKI